MENKPPFAHKKRSEHFKPSASCLESYPNFYLAWCLNGAGQVVIPSMSNITLCNSMRKRARVRRRQLILPTMPFVDFNSQNCRSAASWIPISCWVQHAPYCCHKVLHQSRLAFLETYHRSADIPVSAETALPFLPLFQRTSCHLF